MKKRKIIKTSVIIVLIGIVIIGIFVNLNNKNRNIEKQEIIKEQLGETTANNAYVSMEAHLSELSEKQQELDNVQNTAGKATATAGQILKDYTAYKDGKLITGTMPNNGAVSVNLNAGESYTIPAGYHNGYGKITNAVTNKGTLTLGTTNSTAVDITDGYYTHVNTTAVYNSGYNTGYAQKTNNCKIIPLEITVGSSSVTTLSLDIRSYYSNYANITINNIVVQNWWRTSYNLY